MHTGLAFISFLIAANVVVIVFGQNMITRPLEPNAEVFGSR